MMYSPLLSLSHSLSLTLSLSLSLSLSHSHSLLQRPRVSKCYSESLYDEEEEEGREGRGHSSSSGAGRRRMSSFSYNILEKLKEERFTKENGLVQHFPDGTSNLMILYYNYSLPLLSLSLITHHFTMYLLIFKNRFIL